MISVVMATYNGEKYLGLQLDSILKQTRQDLEVVIIDDCSKDSTPVILRRYASADARIKLHFNEENLGCSRSFEKGINLASGDYLALVDQDDIWLPQKLERLIDEIEEYDLDMVYSDTQLIDENGKPRTDRWQDHCPKFGIDSSNPEIAMIAAFNSFILGCSMVFNAASLKKCLPIEHGYFNHDKWIVSNIAYWGRFKFIAEPLFYYRLHNGNYSMREKNKGLLSRLQDTLKLPSPFYSHRGLKQIISQSDRVTNDRFSQFVADSKDFRNHPLFNRLTFVAKYHRFLYLEKRKMKRFYALVKLPFTDCQSFARG